MLRYLSMNGVCHHDVQVIHARSLRQDYQDKKVLMLAYMNKESLRRTLKLGKTCFWSRSRKEYWVKGLTSGHFQFVKSVAYDCDLDALLIRVRQIGSACHTGNRSCFYRKI